MAYVAETKVKIKGKQYVKGDVIKEKLSKVDADFLKREGCIKEQEAPVKAEPGKSADAKKDSVK